MWSGCTMGWDAMSDEKHMIPSLKGVSSQFNDEANVRSFIGGLPDSDISEYDRVARKDMDRVEMHNPLGNVTPRLSSINKHHKKLIDRMKKEQESFLDLLIIITLQQMEERLNELLEDIEQLINDMQDLRNDMLDLIDQNQNLLDKVENAIDNKDFDRDEVGNFSNKHLSQCVNQNMIRNDLDHSMLKDMTLEQLLAMVHEEVDIIKLENQELSNHVGIISTQIEDLHKMKTDVQKAKDILDSDFPEHLKQKRISDIMKDIDLVKIENQFSQTKSDLMEIANVIEQEEITRIENNQVNSKPDSLFASI